MKKAELLERRLVRYHLAAWGVPAIICLTTLVLQTAGEFSTASYIHPGIGQADSSCFLPPFFPKETLTYML